VALEVAAVMELVRLVLETLLQLLRHRVTMAALEQTQNPVVVEAQAQLVFLR
jgi:hypothetical protein